MPRGQRSKPDSIAGKVDDRNELGRRAERREAEQVTRHWHIDERDRQDETAGESQQRLMPFEDRGSTLKVGRA